MEKTKSSGSSLGWPCKSINNSAIPVTNTSLNPGPITGVAVFAGDRAKHWGEEQWQYQSNSSPAWSIRLYWTASRIWGLSISGASARSAMVLESFNMEA